MKKTSLFSIVLVLSFAITWLMGCGGDEEAEEKPAGSGIAYVYPGGGMSNVPTTTSVMVTFKDDINTPSAANLTFTPGVSGSVSYDSHSHTMIFKPSSPFSGNIEYTMKINGITDKSGKSFSPVDVKFTTSGPDTTSPELTYSYPEDGQKDIAHGPSIVLKFSEPIERPKLESGISLQPMVDPSINEWFFEWTVTGEEEVTIFPTAGLDPLAVNKEYTLVIPKSSVVDLSGNSSRVDHTLTFKTLMYPVEKVGNMYFPNSMMEEAWVYRVGKFGSKWVIFIGGQRAPGGPSVATASFTVTASADGEIHEDSVDYWEAEGRAHTITVSKGNGNRLSFSVTCDQADDYYRLMFTASSRYLTFQFSGVSKEWIHIGSGLTNPSRTPFIMENN